MLTNGVVLILTPKPLLPELCSPGPASSRVSPPRPPFQLCWMSSELRKEALQVCERKEMVTFIPLKCT